jgi:ClpP class serine protease
MQKKPAGEVSWPHDTTRHTLTGFVAHTFLERVRVQYDKYSVDELKQMLKDLDAKMEKEIEEVKQKYETQRKKFTSLIA